MHFSDQRGFLVIPRLAETSAKYFSSYAPLFDI